MSVTVMFVPYPAVACEPYRVVWYAAKTLIAVADTLKNSKHPLMYVSDDAGFACELSCVLLAGTDDDVPNLNRTVLVAVKSVFVNEKSTVMIPPSCITPAGMTCI